MEGLTEGRIVHYVLTDQDALEISRRRVFNVGHAPDWPRGAQAHVGNPPQVGIHCPAIVVAVWPREFEDTPGVNLQVFLDGNDVLWKTSVEFKEAIENLPGTWHWIERA